ncbi:MAG TPA: hypothetical protein VHW46_11425 [Terracidiphilus sp.]|nr:hypothetical protein [Terracidiphilus sp.]
MAAIVLIASIVLVARFDKNYEALGHTYEIKCAQPSEPPSATTSLACTVDPEERASQSESNPPSWHKLIAWPEGITAWLIMLTLGAIVWQSWETRKAAENAGEQLAFQRETLRPRLKISTFTRDTFKEAMAGDWVFVSMKITNTGGLPAYGVVADTWIEFIRGERPHRFSSLAKYNKSDSPLNVHVGDPTGFFIPLHRKLTDEERCAMGHALGTICFRVRLTYRAFTDEVHTDEAFMASLDGMEHIGEYSSET